MTAHASTAWRRPQLAGWVAIVVLISLGIGGLVVTIDHAPTDLARPELTVRRDRAAAGGIAALTGGIGTLSDRVDALRQSGLNALVHVASGDPTQVAADILAGDRTLDLVSAASADIDATLAGLPTGVDRTGLSQANQGKLGSVEDALAAVSPLSDTWRRLAGGAVPSLQLAAVVVDHDGRIASVADADNQQRYADAVRILGEATDLLDGAERLRQEAAADGIDVTDAGEWLLRARIHDEALKNLVGILQLNGGQATADAQAARARADAAGAAIPMTADDLSTQLSDDAQGAINDATVAIDAAAGSLDDTAATLTPPSP